MQDALHFDQDSGTIKTCTREGITITYRAFEGLPYCAKPLDPIQAVNVFVPEGYYHGEAISGYTAETAPVFLPNTVGGYMPGPATVPGSDEFGRTNTLFYALAHGYVAVSAGIRGRTCGQIAGGPGQLGVPGPEGFTGKAPALIVDYKAVIRWLRHNRDQIPGDMNKIITNGTSAGGALSALAGATGDVADYAPYLEEIGAVMDESDAIFAASCYCPVHNLEHADMSYEWLFQGAMQKQKRMPPPSPGADMPGDMPMGLPKPSGEVEPLIQAELALSPELAADFVPYINSLHLQDEAGQPLTLEADGTGSFLEYVKQAVVASAQRDLDTGNSTGSYAAAAIPGCSAAQMDFLSIENGKVTALDWKKFLNSTYFTRSKGVPAFDQLNLLSPENDLFGTKTEPAKHFTAKGMAHDVAGGQLADPKTVAMVNPTSYLESAHLAPHWRIRHGSADQDIALVMPLLLGVLLRNHGCQVDFHLPWALPHGGDYDIPELFAWIDESAGRNANE